MWFGLDMRNSYPKIRLMAMVFYIISWPWKDWVKIATHHSMAFWINTVNYDKIKHWDFRGTLFLDKLQRSWFGFRQIKRPFFNRIIDKVPEILETYCRKTTVNLHYANGLCAVSRFLLAHGGGFTICEDVVWFFLDRSCIQLEDPGVAPKFIFQP